MHRSNLSLFEALEDILADLEVRKLVLNITYISNKCNFHIFDLKLDENKNLYQMKMSKTKRNHELFSFHPTKTNRSAICMNQMSFHSYSFILNTTYLKEREFYLVMKEMDT